MKLIRSVVAGVLFLVGVFLASANTGLVELVYLPALPFAGLDQGSTVRAPVFIVVLAAILLGVLMTGLGVVVEQSRLRWNTRSAERKARQKQRESEQLGDELERARGELANVKQELAAARKETHTARERLAQTEARLARLREQHAVSAMPERSGSATGSTPAPASSPAVLSGPEKGPGAPGKARENETGSG